MKHKGTMTKLEISISESQVQCTSQYTGILYNPQLVKLNFVCRGELLTSSHDLIPEQKEEKLKEKSNQGTLEVH